jgi:DNA topoisomerase-1
MGAAVQGASPPAPPGLVYVNDQGPGICRLRRGKGFSYRQPDGRRLTDAAQLARIRSLAIPPAYTKVWICPLPHGHLQATGRDARGRKQFRYHADWRRARDETKFDRLLDFGASLPRIRARVARDLAAPMGKRVLRETVLATVVRLLDTTLVRVGNDEYARNNGSFGLTTLRNGHAVVKGAELRLRFRGKSGVTHAVSVNDRRVARVVAHCQALSGQQLFEYLDEAGVVRSIGSADVNDYLRAASGGEFTAKDFRTWHGSALALRLAQQDRAEADDPTPPSAAHVKRLLAQVAARLGNTVAVCRKSYVHPRVLAVLTAEMPPNCKVGPPLRARGLTVGERALLEFLREQPG